MIDISFSNGRGKSGKRYAFVRPLIECANRSRRIIADEKRVDALVKKYYKPLKIYLVDGFVIASNSPENALLEYRRICDPRKYSLTFQPIEQK